MPNNIHSIHILTHDRQVQARAGKTLIESLSDHGIFLRSDCGGKGTCGKCRVKRLNSDGRYETECACTHVISEDIIIEIPESSLLSAHIIGKAPLSMPVSFTNRPRPGHGADRYGIAIDLGTTTIAMYLCNRARAEVLSSISVKNPQALYGDDVMSRIGAIGQNGRTLGQMQKLVVRAIDWGAGKLMAFSGIETDKVDRMVAVGNPTMIHILAGIDPQPIGLSPYQPVFFDDRKLNSGDLGFAFDNIPIQTLPHVSGFIGGDILGAALAVDLWHQPEGTVLVDLGTNGEILLKANGGLYATSCATGPAFEGASLSCGMQAIPGAIDKVTITTDEAFPECSCIDSSMSSTRRPSGICGTGVISAVAQFCRRGILAPDGAFRQGRKKYVLVPEYASAEGSAISISQKDIRAVQLGKAALAVGIELLLEKAGMRTPEKIIVAGAFGSFVEKKDMMTLGMIPRIDPARVEISGNSAGAGAVMVLCDDAFLEASIRMADRVTVIDLAGHQNFQDVFIRQLGFPIPAPVRPGLA